MQRIVFRYRKELSASALNHGDLRALLMDASVQAKLPVEDGRRVIMGPPLPPGATSEAEFSALELVEPQDPSEVGRAMNAHLPEGVRLERAWIVFPGSSEENPATLDEAVYDVFWPDAPDGGVITSALGRFLEAAVVEFTRIREKKTQVLNARALVRAITFFESQDSVTRLRMTVSVGSQGTIRTEEVLQALGFSPAATAAIRVHRVALQRSAWRHPFSPASRQCWLRNATVSLRNSREAE